LVCSSIFRIYQTRWKSIIKPLKPERIYVKAVCTLCEQPSQRKQLLNILLFPTAQFCGNAKYFLQVRYSKNLYVSSIYFHSYGFVLYIDICRYIVAHPYIVLGVAHPCVRCSTFRSCLVWYTSCDTCFMSMWFPYCFLIQRTSTWLH